MSNVNYYTTEYSVFKVKTHATYFLYTLRFTNQENRYVFFAKCFTWNISIFFTL